MAHFGEFETLKLFFFISQIEKNVLLVKNESMKIRGTIQEHAKVSKMSSQ